MYGSCLGCEHSIFQHDKYVRVLQNKTESFSHVHVHNSRFKFLEKET